MIPPQPCRPTYAVPSPSGLAPMRRHRRRPGATLCATAWPKGPYLAVGGAFADRASSTWWIACWWTAAAACGTSFARSAGGKSESLTGTSSNYWPKTAPHHAKALGVGRRVAVHVPDAHGHYDSPDSVLYEHNVVAMRAMEQANEDLWIVLADVVERWGRSVSRTHQYGQGRASRDREDGRRDREHGGDAGRRSRSC